MTLQVTTKDENARESDYCANGERPDSGCIVHWGKQAREGV